MAPAHRGHYAVGIQCACLPGIYIIFISVAEPHHFYAAPAPGKNFDAAPAPVAPALAPTQLSIKAKFLK
jgi:hypothetical protein